MLLAEALLHRTRADIAARIYPQLVSEFPDAQAVLDRADRWRELVRPAGLAWRAEAFLGCCQRLALLC
jgi:adenine-specific DNA glycosylase